VTELEVPFPDPYPDLVTILAAFEAFGQHPDDDPLSDPERLRIVAHGRTLSATDLARALAGRMRLAQRVSELMERFDVLATPTVTVEPFDVNAWRPDAAGAALDWLAWCRTVYPFNLTGQPAISVPAGFTAAGLPAGLQLAGRPGQDALVLAVARRFELTRPWRSAYARKNGRPAANRDPAANQQPAAHRNGRPGYARENEEHA
jgi:aspartyl-tRNA(Asn)/glutamyl-tRNA(Gln) amidotransferase subunit A